MAIYDEMEGFNDLCISLDLLFRLRAGGAAGRAELRVVKRSNCTNSNIKVSSFYAFICIPFVSELRFFTTCRLVRLILSRTKSVKELGFRWHIDESMLRFSHIKTVGRLKHGAKTGARRRKDSAAHISGTITTRHTFASPRSLRSRMHDLRSKSGVQHRYLGRKKRLGCPRHLSPLHDDARFPLRRR
ncbi:hypothetical protein K504DRAFT_291972 [Pleomassaria siparia CBS 279.74]|uniref:Uncharacterized protein n=1 Tax=Pleomassaria siparia CBS 279.74 TaxID=1314801 RepID=A0A6G1K829_9PLEO|nr:hypothetical protein K504DRAFT_291972 [Pleomassaria siparia CBS 279.74]